MTRRGASSPQPYGQAPVLSLGPAALHEVVPLPLVGQDSSFPSNHCTPPPRPFWAPRPPRRPPRRRRPLLCNPAPVFIEGGWFALWFGSLVTLLPALKSALSRLLERHVEPRGQAGTHPQPRSPLPARAPGAALRSPTPSVHPAPLLLGPSGPIHVDDSAGTGCTHGCSCTDSLRLCSHDTPEQQLVTARRWGSGLSLFLIACLYF